MALAQPDKELLAQALITTNCEIAEKVDELEKTDDATQKAALKDDITTLRTQRTNLKNAALNHLLAKPTPHAHHTHATPSVTQQKFRCSMLWWCPQSLKK